MKSCYTQVTEHIGLFKIGTDENCLIIKSWCIHVCYNRSGLYNIFHIPIDYFKCSTEWIGLKG